MEWWPTHVLVFTSANGWTMQWEVMLQPGGEAPTRAEFEEAIEPHWTVPSDVWNFLGQFTPLGADGVLEIVPFDAVDTIPCPDL